MCQFSEADSDDETTNLTKTMIPRAGQLPHHLSAREVAIGVDSKISQLSSPSNGLVLEDKLNPEDRCVGGWWRDNLYMTSADLNAQVPAFSAHLDFLRKAQARMKSLARDCSWARLYTNPTVDSKTALQDRLDVLTNEIDLAAKLHDMYFSAIKMYILSVREVIDNLDVSDKECHCVDCTRRSDRWTNNTRTEIRLEANGLMTKLFDARKAFLDVKRDVLKKWEKDSKKSLCRMVSALPALEDLRQKAAVKKYFPRQIREIEEAQSKAAQIVASKGKAVSKGQFSSGKEEYDSGCEILVDSWLKEPSHAITQHTEKQ